MRTTNWIRMAVTAAATAAMLIGLAGCDPEDLIGGRVKATRTETAAFPAAGSPMIAIDSSNGAVTVRGVPGQGDVQVTATVTSRGASQGEADRRAAAVVLHMTQQGGRIVLAYRGSEQAEDVRRHSGVAFDVTTPPMLELGVATSNGAVSAVLLQGRLDLRTSNGEVALTDVVGQAVVATSNGRIALERCRGVFDLETSNGGISLSDVDATFDAVTSNGAIWFSGTPIGEANTLITSNGRIDAVVPASAAVEFTARTSSGSISSPLPLVGDTQGKEWLATLNPPATAKIALRTSNGAITIAARP